LIESLKTELAAKQGKAVPSESQSTNMNTISGTHNNSTSSLIDHNHQSTTTLNIEKSSIKAAQPEPFSGEKARLVNDWFAAVKRYLM